MRGPFAPTPGKPAEAGEAAPSAEFAALGESVERYEVEIYISSTLVATLSSTQQSVTWPIADQRAANAGNPVFSFGVKVWQMSSSVGRGNPGSASIVLPTAVII